MVEGGLVLPEFKDSSNEKGKVPNGFETLGEVLVAGSELQNPL